MFKLHRCRLLHWHNRYCNEPVAVTEFTSPPIRVRPERAGAVFQALQSAFSEKSEVPNNLHPEAVCLWAADAAAQRVDIMPPRSGIVPGAPGRRSAIWTVYRDTVTAPLPGQFAISIIALLGQPGDLTSAQLSAKIDAAARMLEQRMPHYSTRAIGQRALARGIPWRRYSKHSDLVALGFGAKQVLFRLSTPENQSAFTTKLALEKPTSLDVLAAAGMPVGKPTTVTSVQEALRAAERIGYPVTVKPVSGTRGSGVLVGIENAVELDRSVGALLKMHRGRVLVQKHFDGKTYRMLVVGGKLVATAAIELPTVIGDGISTVQELIDRLNADPRRGGTDLSGLFPVQLTPSVQVTLAQQGQSPEAVPEAGQTVLLSRVGNRHSGGIPEDASDIVHPENRLLAERAARSCRLAVGSVDLVCADITRPWHETDAGICELNAFTSLKVHDIAHPEIDAASHVLDYGMRGKGDGRIPTAMVTGDVGKTGTCFILSAILKTAGEVVGLSTTDGVYVDDTRIEFGDKAGTSGGGIVLNDPTVTAAVLETARGGIIKRGLIAEHCDVGALLNIGDDHLGQDGIETREQMLAVKRKVTDAARGFIILNLDDEMLVELSREYPPARIIAYSIGGETDAVARVLAGGGRAVVRDIDGMMSLIGDGPSVPLFRLDAIAGSYSGANHAIVENAMAAAAMATGLGVAPEIIAKALAALPEPEAGRGGRLISFLDGTNLVMLDRGATVKSLPNIGRVLDATVPGRRRVCLVSVNSFRSDAYLKDFADGLLPLVDAVVCYERPSFLRHNGPGELCARLERAFVAAGANAAVLQAIADPNAAIAAARTLLNEGDAFLILGGDADYLVALFEGEFGPGDGSSGTEAL